MNNKFYLFSECALVICMLGLIPFANAQATSVAKAISAVSNSSDGATMYELSKQRRVMIKSIVDEYAANEENLDDSNTLKQINEDISKLMPLIPTGSLEVRSAKDLSDTAKKKMELQYGKEDYEKTLQNEAEKQYPMIEMKQKVTVEYNKGPKHFRVTGTLYRITAFAVTIDDTIIDFVDLPSEERAKFDKQWNTYLRNQYVETHRAILSRKRSEETQAIYDQLKFELFKKNESSGFIYDPNTDNWTNARDCAKVYIDEAKKKIAAEKAAVARQKQATEGTGEQLTGAHNSEADIEDVDSAENKGNARTTAASNKVALENSEENQAQYKQVMEKFEEAVEELAEESGIDAYPAYKKALWGFDISEVRFSLWKEPEFNNLRSELGRDTIVADKLDLEEGGLKIASIDLVYDANALNKVVYMFKNASRSAFKSFKETMTEQYGNIKEDKDGDYLAAVFSGKQEAKVLTSESEQKEWRAGLEKAKAQLEELQAAFDEADDETKDAAEATLKKAQTAVKNLEKKIQSAEKSSVGKEYEYVATRMKFKQDDKGATVLPYTITWKGDKTSGTVFFYYNKQSDRAENIVFVKGVN